MYAAKKIVKEQRQDFYWDIKLTSEIHSLDIDPRQTFTKSRLARLWGVHRTTIARWVQLAIDSQTPGFKIGFIKIVRLAKCPNCEIQIKLTELQYLQLSRKWAINCPHCEESIKVAPSLSEVFSIENPIPKQHAKVLRVIGWLISNYGMAETKRILKDSQDPQHKKIRQSIRNLLIKA